MMQWVEKFTQFRETVLLVVNTIDSKNIKWFIVNLAQLKAFRGHLHCVLKLSPQHLYARVGRKENVIEASMGTW
jgi:hypothetical protein